MPAMMVTVRAFDLAVGSLAVASAIIPRMSAMPLQQHANKTNTTIDVSLNIPSQGSHLPLSHRQIVIVIIVLGHESLRLLVNVTRQHSKQSGILCARHAQCEQEIASGTRFFVGKYPLALLIAPIRW